ncbi:PIN domain-containing protein [Chryseobacterium gregarium]|uniref:PIN domain-containing protein n=1 Tax=Chryseobacterium gregarium TaxID=456299 RepID=UPI0004013E65|nr:PIN domain-containing protein [Chryseobacterium gregarium]
MASKLALDTNIWIYLTKETFDPLFESLKEKIANNEFELLTNEIVIEEWKRNKKSTIKSLCESIKQEFKSAKSLAKFLPAKEKVELLTFLEKLDTEEKRLEKAKLRVEEVEQLLFSAKKIDINDEQKMFVANLAITKKGPFSNNKNNFNDTLILRNFIEHIQKINYPDKYDLIYVSNNPKDFCIDGKENIYPEILDGFDSLRIKSVTELGQAFHLSTELIEDFDDWLEYQVQTWAEMQYEISRGK